MSRDIIAYRLTVHRGERAGMSREYQPAQRTRARRFADRLDNQYGAICCTVAPVFSEAAPAPVAREFRCSPASIATEHTAELLAIYAAGLGLS